MNTTDLSRREREKLAQREEMLAAAMRLFSEKGYGNVSMQEIAQSAEFAIGTLYKFFKSKEDLYKAIIQEGSERFFRLMTEAVDRPEKEVDRLRNYMKVKREFFRVHAPMIRIYFSETLASRSNVVARLSPETRKLHEALLERLATIFENGMKARRFRRIAEPYHLAIALENITNAFLFLWLDEPDTHPFPEDPDIILNILFKGLICDR